MIARLEFGRVLTDEHEIVDGLGDVDWNGDGEAQPDDGVIADINNDGWQDAYVVSGGDNDRLYQSDGSGGFVSGKTVELQDKDPGTGKYIRNIVSSHHAAELGIQPAQYLT